MQFKLIIQEIIQISNVGGVMLYKKNISARKYTRLVTSSPGLFIAFILFSLALLLFLTLSTKIDVIRTYNAEIMIKDGETALLVKADNISSGTAYIYSNKNEDVYPVFIERMEGLTEGYALYFSSDGQNTIRSFSSTSIFIDIPHGKQTLLYHIFVNGGKDRE